MKNVISCFLLIGFSLSVACLLLVPGCSSPDTDNVPVASVPAGGESVTEDDEIAASESADGEEDDEESEDPQATAINREALFQGWPEPKAALFITGRQHGYLEPCGCTGLANQLGGLARRHTFQRQLVDKGWQLVPLDVGNQVRRSGRQAEIKYQITVESLRQMNYKAIGLGPDDLRLSVDELGAAMVGTDDQPSLVVCANAAVYSRDFTREMCVIESGGKKIGVTAVLGADHQKKVVNDLIEIESPSAGLARVWPKLEKEKCDVYVLLCFAALDETKKIAKEFPHFDIVATAGGGNELMLVPETIPDTKSMLVQVGEKGMYVGVIGIFDDPETPLRYQKVKLSSDYADSKKMLEIFKAYQKQLETLGLAGLGIRPIAHPKRFEFVGSERCQDCHDEEYKIWKKGIDGKGGPHAHATESLVHPGERSDIPRHFDPECLSCHVTGWNPQEYYPYKTGYLKLQDALLHANGCENCHGPGSQHIAAESGALEVSDEVMKQLQDAMRLTLEDARKSKCMTCHDLDNSPDFHLEGAFDKYWEMIKH